MHLTSTFHPPARIDPLVVVVTDTPWSFLVATGALLLAAFAYAAQHHGTAIAQARGPAGTVVVRCLSSSD
jgi:hypothetical protein